ncbi:uncharacterized protein EI90DRAFT_3132903 [Cantharellus anzutake]|uniref:uncharacterized protein n=1 Tax=Cantharellus anzutake TaxID=1750568 RepID=UPI001906AF2F|nr:uncharacterized protein EI90DRAFT_3132903 [Cantharellus anzutake]KAF8318913.1 hypothetical protein EI90DRAFT_3132903 [Cantharellus anzutake]
MPPVTNKKIKIPDPRGTKNSKKYAPRETLGLNDVQYNVLMIFNKYPNLKEEYEGGWIAEVLVQNVIVNARGNYSRLLKKINSSSDSGSAEVKEEDIMNPSSAHAEDDNKSYDDDTAEDQEDQGLGSPANVNTSAKGHLHKGKARASVGGQPRNMYLHMFVPTILLSGLLSSCPTPALELP